MIIPNLPFWAVRISLGSTNVRSPVLDWDHGSRQWINAIRKLGRWSLRQIHVCGDVKLNNDFSSECGRHFLIEESAKIGPSHDVTRTRRRIFHVIRDEMKIAVGVGIGIGMAMYI